MGGTVEGYRMATLLSGCEAVFGTTQSVAALVDMWEQDAFNPVVITPTYRSNEKKINGVRGKTRRERNTAEGAFSINDDASVELLTAFHALANGNDTPTGSGDPYTHAIKHPSLCSVAPKSTDFAQGVVCAGLTGGYKSFKGCSVDKLGISFDEKDVKMTSGWKCDGSEVTQAAMTFPTTFLPLSYLMPQMITLKLYPKGGGAIELTGGGSNQLLSGKVDWDFGLARKKRVSNTVYVPGWRYTMGKPSMSISLVIAGDKSDACYGYFNDDATKDRLLTLQLSFTYSASRSFVIDMSDCYVTAKENADDTEPTLELTVDEIDVPANQGPAIYTCKTGVAAYLQGT